MNNLIPTVITDVNGRTTTVHKKTVAEAMQQRKFPAPGQPLSPKLVTRETMKELEEEGVKILSSADGNKNIFHLAKHYPELLSMVRDRFRTAGERERKLWSYLLCETMLRNPGRIIPDRSVIEYRKWLSLMPFVLDLFPETQDETGRGLHVRVNGLATTTSDLLYQHRSIDSDENEYRRVKAALAVIQIDKAAGGYGSTKDRLEDIDFIEANLDGIEPLLPELMRRGNADRGFIQELMDSSASSLNDGIL